MQTIFLGTAENDKTGDKLRVAFGKTNENFEEHSLELENKASKESVAKSVVNFYSGTTPPEQSLGKDNDRYKQYASSGLVNLHTGKSLQNYNSSFFVVFDGSFPSGLEAMDILPNERVVSIFFTGIAPDVSALGLAVDGVPVVLTIESSTNDEIVATYESSADATIQGITTSSDVRLDSEQSTGEHHDWIKDYGRWIQYSVYSRPETNGEFGHTPTRADCTVWFKQIPQNDFAHNHTFYVIHSTGDEMLVRYRANGDTVESGTNYKFFTDILTEAL